MVLYGKGEDQIASEGLIATWAHGVVGLSRSLRTSRLCERCPVQFRMCPEHRIFLILQLSTIPAF